MNKTKTIYKNGAYCTVSLYYTKRPKLHESDRIKLVIHPIGSDDLVVWMHALEAVDIINGLSRAVGDAMAEDLPLLSRD
jgi:hypothetical protein